MFATISLASNGRCCTHSKFMSQLSNLKFRKPQLYEGNASKPYSIFFLEKDLCLLSSSRKQNYVPSPRERHYLYLPKVFAIQTFLNKSCQCLLTRITEVHETLCVFFKTAQIYHACESAQLHLHKYWTS